MRVMIVLVLVLVAVSLLLGGCDPLKTVPGPTEVPATLQPYPSET